LIRNDLQQEIAKLEGLQNRVNQTRLIKSQIQSSTRTQRLQTQAQANEQLEQMNQIQQRIALSQSTSKLAQQRFSIAQKNVARFTDLQQQGVVPKNITEEKLQAALESQELLEKTESEIQQAQSELKKQKSTYDRVTYTGKLTLQESEKQLEELNAQLLDLQTEIKQTAKQIQALQLQRYQRIVRAPANGTIFDLEIEKPGAVVQTSQAIAQIAPAKTPLILRAQMPSQESGFLKLGMPVKLKFDAYSFQDYGVVEGRLSWVAPTSRSIQTAQGAIEVFDIEVTLDRPYLQHQGRKIPMTAGQTASAEVIVRQRRVIDFILDPFKKLQNGGLEL
jgi:HlyD family secretion protein